MPWWTWPVGILAAVGAAWVSVGLAARFVRLFRPRYVPAAAPTGAPSVALASDGMPASTTPSEQRGASPDPQNEQFQPEDDQQPREPLLRFLALRLGFVVLLSAVVLGALTVYGWRQFPQDTRFHVPGGNPERGRELIVAYGCGTCHTVPDVNSATGRVGPQLHGFREQMFVAGVLPNTPDNLIEWVQNPKEIDPLTAMPDLGVSEAQARDIAAYLYSNP